MVVNSGKRREITTTRTANDWKERERRWGERNQIKLISVKYWYSQGCQHLALAVFQFRGNPRADKYLHILHPRPPPTPPHHHSSTTVTTAHPGSYTNTTLRINIYAGEFFFYRVPRQVQCFSHLLYFDVANVIKINILLEFRCVYFPIKTTMHIVLLRHDVFNRKI